MKNTKTNVLQETLFIDNIRAGINSIKHDLFYLH